MCGRFNLTASGEELAEAFDLDEVPVLKPRFNIAPSQPIAVVSVQAGTGRRGLSELVWGLVVQGPRPGSERRLINVRAETASRRPAFRDAYAHRRCLVPATGFYEWLRTSAERPRPWLFRMRSGRPFALAGIWQPAGDAGGAARCAILTTEPNELARRVHDRMPAILAPGDYAAWLDPSLTEPRRLQPLLAPYSTAEMTSLPVSTAVNSPANDGPACVEPA